MLQDISSAFVNYPGLQFQHLMGTKMNNDASGLEVYLFIMFLLALYYIPTIIAFSRKHPNRWLIGVINTIFGSTGIGWLGALVWALQAIHISDSPEGSNGGESGLNLFVNDAKKIELLRPDNIATELDNLHNLFQKNAITLEQYTFLRDEAISRHKKS